jgi:hypothetical protein
MNFQEEFRGQEVDKKVKQRKVDGPAFGDGGGGSKRPCP